MDACAMWVQDILVSRTLKFSNESIDASSDE